MCDDCTTPPNPTPDLLCPAISPAGVGCYQHRAHSGVHRDGPTGAAFLDPDVPAIAPDWTSDDAAVDEVLAAQQAPADTPQRERTQLGTITVPIRLDLTKFREGLDRFELHVLRIVTREQAAEIARLQQAIDLYDGPVSVGSALIDNERRRQIEKEGWTAEHDDVHDDGDLHRAAVAYIAGDVRCWPWDRVAFKPDNLIDPRVRHKPSDRDLARAGALIAAELDRRHREANR